MGITFSLLGLSICAVWLPTLRWQDKPIPVWPFFFVGALVSGLVMGYLKPVAIIEIGIVAICAYLLGRSTKKGWKRQTLFAITAIGVLALAMHTLPGFKNPMLIESFRFSANAAPFTQYLNFDKAAAGLILLVFLCARSHSAADWQHVLRRAGPLAGITAFIVMSTALLAGFLKPDFKLSSYTLLFFATNLLFTCVAEEAFFRGFIQARLEGALARFRYAGAMSVAVTATLFGVAHLGGGLTFAMLATIVGLGSGYAYFVVRRIEAPIIVHFAVNAVHFIFFTYPHI